jgi:hypothetical protein
MGRKPIGNPPTIECSFLVPIRRDENLSDGQPHSRKLWDWLDDLLFKRFGGRTIAPGHFQGSYRDPDTRQQVFDLSTKYIVAVPEARLDELRLLLSGLCCFCEQKCIYLSVAGKVEFIEA